MRAVGGRYASSTTTTCRWAEIWSYGRQVQTAPPFTRPLSHSMSSRDWSAMPGPLNRGTEAHLHITLVFFDKGGEGRTSAARDEARCGLGDRREVLCPGRRRRDPPPAAAVRTGQFCTSTASLLDLAAPGVCKTTDVFGRLQHLSAGLACFAHWLLQATRITHAGPLPAIVFSSIAKARFLFIPDVTQTPAFSDCAKCRHGLALRILAQIYKGNEAH